MTFDFCYCNFMLEQKRSTYDSKVLIDIIDNHRFSISEDKYYLIDTGYCNSDYTMIPY